MEIKLLRAVNTFKLHNRLIKSRSVALEELAYTHPDIQKILAKGVTHPAKLNRSKNR